MTPHPAARVTTHALLFSSCLISIPSAIGSIIPSIGQAPGLDHLWCVSTDPAAATPIGPKSCGRTTEICVTAVDLPGHGKSQGKGHDTVKGFAAVLDAFIRAMNFSRVILMGHSLGGAIAQTLALEAPTWLEKIILVGTGARLRVDPSILEALLVGAGSAAELISALGVRPFSQADSGRCCST